MKEKEIIQKFVNALSEIDGAKAIAANDFTEEREPYMIVVGIDNTTQVNVGLPDYQYKVSIVIDCFVDDDLDGTIFDEIHKGVRRVI